VRGWGGAEVSRTCIGDLPGCTGTTPANALDGADGVAVTSTLLGRQLYAVSRLGNVVSHFKVATPCGLTGCRLLGPKFFGLSVRGAGRRGATVTAVLRKPRALVLEVFRVRGHRPARVGFVRLGSYPAGRSRIHWNLHVHGHLLPEGRYTVILYASVGNRLSEPSAPGPRTLIVLAHGRVRVAG
jgi:hypothetical protein